MRISRDAIEIAVLFALLIGIFIGAGMVWWGLFLLAVGIVLLGFELYLWKVRGETLSQQVWRLWEERPYLALFLWLALVTGMVVVAIHLLGR